MKTPVSTILDEIHAEEERLMRRYTASGPMKVLYFFGDMIVGVIKLVLIICLVAPIAVIFWGILGWIIGGVKSLFGGTK